VISCALSPSLLKRFDLYFPGSQARGPYTPNLPIIDPGIFFGGGGETDVCKDVERWLAVSRRRLAIARQRNPTAVVGLDGQVQVKLHATIGSHSQIVDATRTPHEAASTATINGKVKSGSLQRNRFPAGKDRMSSIS
jgi:hypothetical protein